MAPQKKRRDMALEDKIVQLASAELGKCRYRANPDYSRSEKPEVHVGAEPAIWAPVLDSSMEPDDQTVADALVLVIVTWRWYNKVFLQGLATIEGKMRSGHPH